MIPLFPDFKKLELSDEPDVTVALAHNPVSSDHHFTGIFTYNINSDVSVSMLNGNLVYISRDYLTGEDLITYNGNNRPLETITTLLDYAAGLGLNRLSLVPEYNIASMRTELRKLFRIKLDRPNFDYIVKLTTMFSLCEKMETKMKKDITSLINSVPTMIAKNIDIGEVDIQSAIFRVFDVWQQGKNLKDDEVRIEKEALLRVCKFSKHFDLFTMGIYIGKELVGFTINEYCHNSLYIGHFGKADKGYRGIYQLMELVTAHFAYNKGYRYLNMEQDLGIEELRRAKMIWKPKFLKKYTVYRKLK